MCFLVSMKSTNHTSMRFDSLEDNYSTTVCSELYLAAVIRLELLKAHSIARIFDHTPFSRTKVLIKGDVERTKV